MVQKSYMETHYFNKEDKEIYRKRYTRYIHKRYFKKSGKLLDIGCNSGGYMEGFRDIGYDCYGVDKDLDQIKLCLGKGFKIKQFDAETQGLPYPNETFDFVFCKSVIEHISLTRIIPLLKEFRRVLKKGGKLFILTDYWKRCYKVFYDDATHLTPMTKKRVIYFLEMSGFEETSMRLHHNIPFLWRFFPSALYISRPFPARIESISYRGNDEK